MNEDKKWQAKEARELFSKTVNSLIINNKNIDNEPTETIEVYCEIAKAVVDKAFEYYPTDVSAPKTKMDKAQDEMIGYNN